MAECRELNTLTIPEHVKNIEFLRRLPALKKLDYVNPGYNGQRIRPVEEFWREYDAKKK